MRAAVLSPCPSAFHPPLPTCPGEGPLGPGLGGGGTLSVSNTGLLGYTSPSPCALDPNPALPSCARRMYPEGALLGRLQSTVQTLVGWEPPSPRGEEGGKGFRTQPGQMTSPRGLDQSRVLGHPRKGLLSAPGGNGSSSPSHHCRMGEREDCRVWAGDGTEAVQVWGKEDAPHSQALERYHALKEPTPLPSHRALKTPSFLSYSSPSQGRKRGTQTCQLRSGVGAEETPKMYCLETWSQEGCGRTQGAGISNPPPQALGSLQEAPLQPTIWP